MAKLKMTFIINPDKPDENKEWVLDHVDARISETKAKQSLERLKHVKCLLKSNGAPLYRDVKHINAQILEESAVLTVSKV